MGTNPGLDVKTMFVEKDGVSVGALRSQNDPRDRSAYRFSFRREGASGAWNPAAQVKISNGDSVTWWCHSLGKGAWADVNNPPLEAYQMYRKKADDSLLFETPGQTLSSNADWEPAVFQLEFE